MSKPSWFQNLSLLIIATLLFGAGFYFGYKNGAVSSVPSSATNVSPSVKNSSSFSPSSVAQIQEPITEVYWIKPGQPPQCPSTHPIKGVFDSNSGWFYTQDNSRYSRINPDICFVSEDFAGAVAGFIKKF